MEGMNKNTRRSIFWGLVMLFVIYSFAVDTVGTSEDKGAAFLTAEAKQGKLLFQKYNCTACHQLYGLGGYMGPDLTNVVARPGRDTAYLHAILANGTARMPDFHLSAAERRAFISYLRYTNQTGQSPAVDARVEIDGSITLPNEN